MATGFAQRFKGKIKVGQLWLDCADGLTAHAGGGQSSALALTKQVNRIATVATAADSVALPSASPGEFVIIVNDGANACQVFGAGSDTINDVATATGVSLAAGSTDVYVCPAAGKWYSIGGGSATAGLFTSVTLSGLLYESHTDTITAHAGGGQSSATPLTTEMNRVTTVATAGDSVALPASAPGLTIIVENAAANPMQVFGAGTDTINGVATGTGVSQMPSSVVIYTCYTAGAWFANGLGTGYSGSYETMSFATGISAAGTGQSTATPLTAMLNVIGTVTSGTGVNLPASAPGMQITVVHTGANPLLVYPAQGASDTINGVAATAGIVILPGTVATFCCAAAGVWEVQPASTTMAAYNTNSATTSTTLTAANVTGAVASVDLALTGTLTGAANATMPTVAAVVAVLHAPTVGTSYRLRITNRSSGAYTWTVVTNTGWTLTGTMTIAQNTWREFVVTLTSLTAATLQSVAVGTYS